MKNELFKTLFNFDINKYKKISISKNEIYNQLILYIFFASKRSLVIVYPTLNEATESYNELKNYIDDIYIFPEDDFITKKAIASSPELLYMRSKLYNKVSDNNKKIVIVHLNSFIKKLPSKKNYIDNKLTIKKGQNINRNDLIKKLDNIGYKKESMVYDISEYAVRGFVIDVYPIGEEYPVRIEFFDDEIEKIKYFDPVKQITNKEIDEINIGIIRDDYDDNKSSVLEYVNDPIVIYNLFLNHSFQLL